MNETQLKKRLSRAAVWCSVLGLVILLAGAFIASTFHRALQSLALSEFKEEASGYRTQIILQLEQDSKSLSTLAALFEQSQVLDDEHFSTDLLIANHSDTFETLGYFNAHGIGTLVNTELGMLTDVDYHTLPHAVQASLTMAYRGIPDVSRLYESDISEARLLVCAVPVYQDGNIVGVLAGSTSLTCFDEILSESASSNQNSTTYLINAQGQVLAGTTDLSSPEYQSSIFSADFFDQADLNAIEAAIAREESIFSTVRYQGVRCNILVEPVGLNNWFVLCISAVTNSNHTIYQMVITLGVTFLLLAVLILVLLVYIWRLTLHHNRTLTRMAYTDELTGADNLNRFMQNLDALQHRQQSFCMVSLNVRQFKFINELFGSSMANQLLKTIAQRVRGSMGEGEFFCREGGDLFYLVFLETDACAVKKRTTALMEDIGLHTVSTTRDYRISLYAGAYLVEYPNQEELSTELIITRSRFAIQHCRDLPSTSVHFYDTQLHNTEERENFIESHMHQALQRGEFQMYLQPQINLKDGSLGSAEALVRWVIEDGHIIFPNDFIPLFERNGFCSHLDLYMVEQAMRQIRQWMDSGIAPLPISVNQSKLLFYRPDYISTLEELLQRYQVPAQLITLEILEQLSFEQTGEPHEKLRKLRKLGFRVSMDDFGSGYASFHTLGSLEIDELKLDRSFLLEISARQSNRFALILECIVKLTKRLNITTVVEGVETVENETLIRNLNCDMGQGYLYSRPIPAEEFTQRYMTRKDQ